MSDIKQAAERLLKGARAYRDGQHNHQSDLQLVADAYFDEHPPDDDEPIDEPFLKSLGFESMHQESEYLWHRESGIEWIGIPRVIRIYRASTNCQTRGQLRSLLKGLGVTAK